MSLDGCNPCDCENCELEAEEIQEKVKRLETKLAKAVKALDAIDHELGRPEGLGIPAPIVNASMIAREALKELGEE